MGRLVSPTLPPRGTRTPSTRARAADRASLLRDARGAVYAEYTILLVLVAVVGSLAIAGLAVPLIQYYRSVQTTVVSPSP